MSRLLAQSVNQKHIKKALEYVSAPGDHFPMVTARCLDLLEYVRRIEADIEADKVGGITGLRPQDRREHFKKLAKQLDAVAEEFNIFQEPLRRHLEDRQFWPTRPIGLNELRTAAAEAFSLILTADFIGQFGIMPLGSVARTEQLAATIRENREFAIAASAERVIPGLLKVVASTLREAEERLRKKTPRGGPRESEIRNAVLINTIALWHDLHPAKKRASYNRGRTKFFKFCHEICMAFNAGYLCSESHLRSAVVRFNRRIYQKPD